MFEQLTSIPGYQVYIWLMSILGSAAIHLRMRGDYSRPVVVETLLIYLAGVGGFISIISFFMHTFAGDMVAASIGWPAGNPFQTEVGVANLAIGVLGYATFWRRDWWLPYIIAASIFGWGAGFTHIADMLSHGNFSPDNAGPILYWDFLKPVALVTLYWLHSRYQSRTQNAGAAYKVQGFETAAD